MESGVPALKSVHLSDYEPINPDVLQRLPIGLIRQRLVVPVAMVNGVLIAAMPSTAGIIIQPQGLEMVAHCPVELVTAPADEILKFIREKLHLEPASPAAAPPVAPSAPNPISAPISVPLKTAASLPAPAPVPAPVVPPAIDLKGPLTLFVPDPAKVASPPSPAPSVAPPVVIEGPPALVRVVQNAIRNNATDVLIERENEKTFRIRQRIRGVLVSDWHSVLTTAEMKEVFDFLGTRGEFHSDGSLRWTEHSFSSGALRFDFFLSETKTFSSLTVGLRRQESCSFFPEEWGMSPNQAKVFDALLARSNGVLIFCGLEFEAVARHIQATARKLSSAERHVIRVSMQAPETGNGIEEFASDGDPVRFQRFAALAFRHSPDVVILDSIDSSEVARLAFAEAAKGRLVIARMSAPDTAGAVVQFLGMGFEPYHIGATLSGVIAERSLRLLCPHCVERESAPRETMKGMGVAAAMQPSFLNTSKGCDECLKTGFDRDVTMFEVLEMTDEVRSRLTPDMKPETLRSLLRSGGFMTFRQTALHKSINGQTSLAEVLRVTA